MNVEPFAPIGQPFAIQLLQKMVATGRVGGSYLFIGPRGVGKKTAARFFAMAINCQEEGPTPCGQCEACRKILANSHPDLLRVTPEADRQAISIEQVRQLQEILAFGPYEGKRRLVMIDPAERLGPEAANALLLTLEAPPPHTLFVLVTSTPYALLETIRSRCQIIRFSPLSRKALLKVARRLGVTVAPTDPVLDLCQGSVTHLLTFLEPEVRDKFEEMDILITSFLMGSPSPDLIETPKWAKQRVTMEEFLERALWLVRNVWVTLEGKKGSGVMGAEAVDKIVAHLPPSTNEWLPDLLETILRSLEDLKHHASPELVFDTLRIEMEELSG